MSDTLKEFLSSGKRMIFDTKQPKIKTVPVASKAKEAMMDGEERDPHKRFVKYCIKNKPDTKEFLKEIQKFIDEAEAKL